MSFLSGGWRPSPGFVERTPYETTAWNHDHNVPHALNTTNLHLHGMDVISHLFDPVGTSDPKASMIAFEPGFIFT